MCLIYGPEGGKFHIITIDVYDTYGVIDIAEIEKSLSPKPTMHCNVNKEDAEIIFGENPDEEGVMILAYTNRGNVRMIKEKHTKMLIWADGLFRSTEADCIIRKLYKENNKQ